MAQPVGTIISTLRDGHRAWAHRCGSTSEPQVLLAADPTTPATLLGPLVYAVGVNAVLVADPAPQETPDRVPAETEHLVTVLIDGGSILVSRGGPTLATGSQLPDLSGRAPPRVGCALVATLTGDFGGLVRTWDATRAQGVSRVRISLPLEDRDAPVAVSPAVAPTASPTSVDPNGSVVVLPVYTPPPWIYDGADRCGTNPSFEVPNIECECM